jgi:hypothetical protein
MQNAYADVVQTHPVRVGVQTHEVSDCIMLVS